MKTPKKPYIDEKLLKKVKEGKGKYKHEPIKTYARRSIIPPEFVGSYISIHNGRTFIPVYITENMVGHKLGELAPTRTFRTHGHHTAKATAKK